MCLCVYVCGCMYIYIIHIYIFSFVRLFYLFFPRILVYSVNDLVVGMPEKMHTKSMSQKTLLLYPVNHNKRIVN